jgi:hypothetical protein
MLIRQRATRRRTPLGALCRPGRLHITPDGVSRLSRSDLYTCNSWRSWGYCASGVSVGN